MKKTKKALLAALACAAAIAGAIGLAACDSGNGGGGGHTHDWGGWTVATPPQNDTPGKATRTCNNSGCDATNEDTELVLPAFNGSESVYSHVTKTKADCSTDGVLTYTYDKDGNHVEFDVNTGKDADVHDYVYTNEGPTGHTAVCSHNGEHLLEKTVHDTNGVNGGCAACGIEKVDVTAVSETRYSVTVTKSGYYEIWSGVIIALPSPSPIYGIGKLGDGDSLDSLEGTDHEIYLYKGTTYYINTPENDVITVVLTKAHEHSLNTEWKSDARGHWHDASCHDGVMVDFAKHEFGEWSEPDEEGTENRSCACGYKEYQIIGTPIQGSYDWEDTEAINCTESNNYIVTVTAVRAEVMSFDPRYDILPQYFSLTNEGDTAKQYTIKILNDNTNLLITTPDGDYYYISEVGEIYTITLQEGETLSIDVTTNDDEGDEDKGYDDAAYEGYSVEAMFRIIVADAA